MSVKAVKWALELAPPMPAQLVATLVGLANHAGEDGKGAFPSLSRLAAYTCKSERSVRRDLRQLEELGLIRAGDPDKVAHLPADRRPEVYDLVLSLVVSGGRAGDDEGTRASVRTLVSSRERGRATRAAKKASSEVEMASERGDVDVRADADVRGDVDVTNGGTPTSQRADAHVTDGGTPTSAKPSVEPSLNRPKNQPPNGRRPTTGSRGRASSGSAALDEVPEPGIDAAAVSCVLGLLPRRLRDQLPNPVPRAVSDAIASEVARGLTADQLVARAERRWLDWGYESDAESAEGPGILRPVGVAISLVRRGKCAHPRCDDGTDLDTETACRTCEREAEDRAATQTAPVQGAFLAAVPDVASVPAPRPAPMRACKGCERPSRKLPADGWCRDCRPNTTTTGRTGTA